MRELDSPSDQETQAGHPWKYQELCLEMKQQTKRLGAAPTTHPLHYVDISRMGGGPAT